MCGICGIYNFQAEDSVNESILVSMRDSMCHRGPDDAGIFIGKNVGIGVRRLSIIDLYTGHQPIFNEDGTILVVLNGEIYNYLELREELVSKGHKFRSKSDTEVIVHLYEELGDLCVEKLTGMFAFAIFDEKERKLFLARDRLGIKPLFYTQTRSSFIFASELKAILKFPAVKRELDFDSLNRYLTLEYIPAPYTIVEGIKKLLPGHTLKVEQNKLIVKKYWDIKYEDYSGLSEEECREKVLDLLRTAVKRRLISDVPLGVFLSGGIDSSSIAALAKINSNESVKTFTIGFRDASFDESGYAKRVSSYLGANHYQLILEPIDVLALISETMKYLDEPLGDASIIPTYLLSSFTREHVKVALAGDGGDELFAGYPTYQAHKLLDIYTRIPLPVRKGVIEKIIRRLPVSMKNFSLDFRLKKFIEGVDYIPEFRNAIWVGSFSPDEKKGLFRKDILRELKSQGCFDFVDLNQYPNEDQLNKILHVDMNTYLRDDLLPKTDITSMANSLEVRLPFLDHNLVEFAVNIPSHLKLRGWTSKYILKRAMRDMLPSPVIARKKKGFGMPVAFWLQTVMRDFVMDIFSKTRIQNEGIFEYKAIEGLIDDHMKNKKDNRKPIWTLLMFELWYEKFMARK